MWPADEPRQISAYLLRRREGRQELFGAAVTTFEYLGGYAAVNNSDFSLLGIYRPGSQAVSSLLFGELITFFDQLATYSWPTVVCWDFNIRFRDIKIKKLFTFKK